MSSRPPHETEELTRLVVTVFRAHGLLVAAGNRFLESVSLTTARWQVLGIAATSSSPMSAAAIARSMGLTRQAVRLIVNQLVEDGLLTLSPDPQDRRAPLAAPTPLGRRAHEAAFERQSAWAAEVVAGIEAEQIANAADLLGKIVDRLEGSRP